jgi:NADH-quinone oxidoreductase subunit N
MIILIGGAAVLFLLPLTRGQNMPKLLPLFTLVIILLALIVAFKYPGQGSWDPQTKIVSEDESLRVTAPGMWVIYLGLMFSVLLVLIAWNPQRTAVPDDFAATSSYTMAPEFFALLLTSIAGLVLLAVANNLIILFLALELVSLPTYVMVTLSRWRMQAKEAGLKYFFLGALAAAIMAYGFSFLYGLTGQINLDAIGPQLIAAEYINPLCIIALILVIIGLCFKIAAVPMHFYVADVYQGAACPVTAMLAFVPKFAGFYALILITKATVLPLLSVSPAVGNSIGWLFWLLAAATMTAGNLLALMQNNVKRLLAYSSIAHSGYIILAFLALPQFFGTNPNPAIADSAQIAIIFYVAVYGVATLGAFAVLSLLERQGDEAQQITDLSGLAKKHPGYALALAVCIFSLIGMPLTAGFIGKFYIFSSLIQSAGLISHYWIVVLLVIAVINAAIAAAYYLRIIGACYLDDGPFTAKLKSDGFRAIGITAAAIITILLGIVPSLLLSNMEETPAPAESTTVVERGENLLPAPHPKKEDGLFNSFTKSIVVEPRENLLPDPNFEILETPLPDPNPEEEEAFYVLLIGP